MKVTCVVKLRTWPSTLWTYYHLE